MEHKPFALIHPPTEQLPNRQPLSALPEEQPVFPNASSSMLREVAQITAQSFHSSEEAMRVALEVIGRFLECQTLFIGRVGLHESGKMNAASDENSDQHTLKIMEVRNRGTSSPSVGSEGPLDRTYCQTVWQTQQPLIIEDVTRHPFYQRLATTEEYNIGSYIGVPLIYSDGRVYGTLCSQDPHPRPFTEQPEKLELMQIVARFLISHIEREELTTHLREAEQAQARSAREEQLAHAETDRRVHELEAVFEAMGDGLLVCDLNGQLQMNAAARNLTSLDLPPDNLQRLFASQSEVTFVLDEDGRPLIVEQLPIMRVLRGEHLIGAKAVNIQRMNALGEKRYLNISGMPIYDQQEQINGGVLVFRDITERYLLEQRTRETLNALLTFAESLAWLPENAPEFFSVAFSHQESSLQLASNHLTQLISTILLCQDVRMISIEPDTAKWQLFTDCGPAQAREFPWWQEARQIFASSQNSDTDHLRNNEVVLHALRPQTDADTPMLVEAPMFLGNRLLGVLALLYHQHDPMLTPAEDTLAKAVAKLTGLVYERERLLQEQAETRAQALVLQETNHRFNEFLSIASHELKGPLTTIKGNIQLSRRVLHTLLSLPAQEHEESFGLLEKMQRYLERAEHRVRIQDRLTNDLLDVSRIRAGKLELHMQLCDMGQIVREIVEDQRQMAEGRVINLELPMEKIVLHGDADRLGQVVSNYLTNALKYSSSDKPIGVTVTTDGDRVCVMVSDQGEGLTPEEQERVWECFYRTKGVHVLSGNDIGLGLGLHICKTIVEQHGGRVGLHSAPGKGSRFWFTLPLIEKDGRTEISLHQEIFTSS